MNEVEKMYENAGIKKQRKCELSTDSLDCCFYGLMACADCDVEREMVYPPFTAEKQLELIKLIANRKGYPDYEYFGTLFDDYIQLLNFNEALAKLVNSLWQDLTDAEKVQIKEILE